MKLPNLEIADSYRSDSTDVVQDFYLPVLAHAVRYDRAVGFFTSRSLALLASGLEKFQANHGKIRIVASPHLSEEDIEDIRAGYEYREVITRAVARQVNPDVERSDLELFRLGLLGRLIAQDSLEIKIAVVENGGDIPSIYHEKIGVIADRSGASVAFTGSMNETASAYTDNFESIEVFKSWVPGDSARVARITRNFSALWDDRTPRIKILDFPAAANDHLQELARMAATPSSRRSPSATESNAKVNGFHGWASLPPDIEIRDYQKEAITAWLQANGRGLFQMATGTGKTITALAALDQLGRQLRARGVSLVTVIVVPLLDLVEQWSDELRKFGVTALKCRDSVRSWEPATRNAIAGLQAGSAAALTLIVTNKTFGGAAFQDLLRSIRAPLLIIADEAHHLGARHLRTALPANAELRLALSATPERWFDEEGTAALHDYFGETLIRMDLKDAIRLGVLTPYRYVPVLVPLTDDESVYYAELTKKIGALYRKQELVSTGEEDNSPLGQLLSKRAKVLGHAEHKLSALQQEVVKRRHQPFQLVYCAEGSRPTEEGPEEPQVDQVLDLLGNGLGMRVHPYTAQEPKAYRRSLLRAFGEQELEVLVSMRCLDEGVDLPDARVAYMLASSSNPRQFIQRRGRILRRAPGKYEAEVVDFIAVPPQDPDLYEIEQGLFRREMTRIVEFARYADNYGEALDILRDLRKYYNLMDI